MALDPLINDPVSYDPAAYNTIEPESAPKIVRYRNRRGEYQSMDFDASRKPASKDSIILNIALKDNLVTESKFTPKTSV